MEIKQQSDVHNHKKAIVLLRLSKACVESRPNCDDNGCSLKQWLKYVRRALYFGNWRSEEDGDIWITLTIWDIWET